MRRFLILFVALLAVAFAAELTPWAQSWLVTPWTDSVARVSGALMRVLLPLTVGFNLQLLREPRASRLWPWLIAGNLHLAGVLRVMPLV